MGKECMLDTVKQKSMAGDITGSIRDQTYDQMTFEFFILYSSAVSIIGQRKFFLEQAGVNEEPFTWSACLDFEAVSYSVLYVGHLQQTL